MLTEITVGVLTSLIYDFIKKGYEISKPVLQEYLSRQSHAITDEAQVEVIEFIQDNNMEAEVIECIKADDVFAQQTTQKTATQAPTQETLAQHITTSPIWQQLLTQLNNRHSQQTHIHGNNINISNKAENSTVHTGNSDILNGNSRKIITNSYVEQQTIIEHQTIQATNTKKP